MEILHNLPQLWGSFMLTGIALYLVALVCVGVVALAVHTKHTIVGAILALLAGLISQVGRIVFYIGIILGLIKIVLIFI